MGSLGEVVSREELFLSSSSGPVVFELNRLENLLRAKERELGVARKEIKTLKQSEVLKDKALLETNNELKRMDDKLRYTVGQLEQKNLEVKRIINEKKDALSAQFSAEATLRRVYASKKDEKFVSVEAITAPYESAIKRYQSEIAALKDDNKALERLMRSKEEALVKVDNMLQNALEQAMFVETLRNQNLELKRQLEICQEENKFFEKRNHRKVVEVEKLSQTICELEESILAGGETANAVRHYQRQVSKLNEDKRILERELARVKILANRVATVKANEWKEDDEKVMPVKQWLQERKIMQAEIQRLRDKIAIAERTAKAELQLKVKTNLRLKALEEGLKHASNSQGNKVEFHNQKSRFPSCRNQNKPSTSQMVEKCFTLKIPKLKSEGSGTRKSMKLRKNLYSKFITVKSTEEMDALDRKSRLLDDTCKQNTETNVLENGHTDIFISITAEGSLETDKKDIEEVKKDSSENECEDTVSGFLYDRLQKEVITLRKSHTEKDCLLD